MNKLTLFILIVLTNYTSAESPVYWDYFVVQSENKKWSAVIQRLGMDDGVKLSVYEGFYIHSPSPSVKPKWSRAYIIGDYPNGFLSNNGEYFSPSYLVAEQKTSVYTKNCTVMRKGLHFYVENDLKNEKREFWLKSSNFHLEVKKNTYSKIKTANAKELINLFCHK